MMPASVMGGARSGNARCAYCLAPNSGNREEKGRLEFVNVTMPLRGLCAKMARLSAILVQLHFLHRNVFENVTGRLDLSSFFKLPR
jgi:hypothetical protein